jgi:hypothetical protein
MEHLVTFRPLQRKRRLGLPRDGGYVVVDGLSYDAYISCGISHETSFDEDFVARYPGIPAHAYDGTVDRPASLPARVVFHRVNIGPTNTRATTTLRRHTRAHEDIFLKMDIEGHEWRWLLAVTKEDLLSFKQIVVELHGLWDDAWEAPRAEKEEAVRRLAETHYLVHAHGNNYSPKRAAVPYVLEATYVRKDVGVAGLNTTPFPVPGLDRPNDPRRADHVLCEWPFVASSER